MRRRLLYEQRGSISVLAGISLIFVIGSAAMTVDIGQATWKKRSLQRLVDVVSLDAVRAVGDRRSAITNCLDVATQFAQEASTRNGFDYANSALGNAMTVEVGWADSKTKAFTVYPSPSMTDCSLTLNAVRITAWSRSDNRFIPGNVGLNTQAVAMMDGKTTYSLGSKLVSIDTTTSPILNSVLGGMLHGSVNLSAVGYNGLTAASVSLGSVWTNLGLGTPSQILNSEITWGQFLDATISALNSQGDPTSVAAASTLGTLKSQIDTSVHFKWGDMLEAASGDPGDAANAKMNVLDMIGMAASAANGTNLLNLTVPITIPGVTSTTMKVALIEPPVICAGCRVGSPAVHTGQVRIQLDSTLTTKLTVLLQQGTVHLPVYLESAGATGLLTKIRCASPVSNSDITVRTTVQPVTAKVGTATDSTLNDPTVAADVRAGQIVSITGLVNVTGTATSTMASSVTDLVIPLLQTLTAGSANTNLSGGLVSTLALNVQVLGLGVNASSVASSTLAIINPVLSSLDSTLLTPLKKALGSLGISLGSADVTNMDETCTARRLIG